MIKKTILITGSCGRIGSSIANQLFKKKIYNLILVDSDKNKIKIQKKKFNNNSVNFLTINLNSKKNIDLLFLKSLKICKKIDTVIHCAYPKSKGWGTRFEHVKEKFLKEDLFNHLGITILFCQNILKHFLKFKNGNLILISSIQGIQAPKFEHYRGLNMSSPIEYSAIKSGIISISKYLAKYYKKNNIRINCISPGGIEDNQHKKFKARYKSSCNSKGLLSGHDVANAVLFLISKESQFINGQNIVVDDGWLL